MSDPADQRKLAAIMFTDMVGYSALAQQNEALALELLEEHRRLLRALLPRFGGTEVKTIGDAFLFEFASALEAARCAIEIQRTLAHRNTDVPSDRQIQVRIGIHLGDVIHREGDVLGDGVNIASRIEPLAEPGGICISRAVFEQVRNKLQPPPSPLGEAALKNIQVPVEVYRVVLPWQTPAAVNAADFASEAAATISLRPSRGLRWATLALVLFALATVVWRTWMKWPSRAPPRIASIAVRPVDDFSGDTNQAFLCDGMTDALCSGLGNLSALRVPGRSSVMGYKGRAVPIRQMADELKVDAILESSLQRSSNRIRVTVQLVEAKTDRHLWSTNYDRDLGDFFKVQSEVAQAVAAEIQLRLTPDDRLRLARVPTGHPAAVETCLKGRSEFLKFTPEGLTNAFAYYRQAINIDSNYPPAWSGLAGCYGVSTYLIGPDKQAALEARAAVDRALSLDPDDPWAHYNIGYGGAWLSDWDWPRARAEVQRAIRVNPSEPLFHAAYSVIQAASGEFEVALREADQACALEPANPFFRLVGGSILFGARRYGPAIQQFQEVLALDDKNTDARCSLGLTYLEMGRTNEAIQELQATVQLAPSNAVCRANLGYACGVLGRRSDALDQLKAIDQLPWRQPGGAWDRAVIHVGLGQTNEALAFLERALGEKDPAVLWLKVDSTFDRLRGEPRFKAMLKKVGLDK